MRAEGATAPPLAGQVIEGEAGPVDVLVGGSGPPVVLVHASGMGAQRWARLCKRWVDRYTLWVPSLVGYGQSGPFDAATWSLDDEVALLEAVVEAAGRPVHVFAHSFGGLVALRLAARRPEALRSLSVYEPTVFGLLHAARDRRGLADLAAFDADGRFLDPAYGATDAWLGTFVDYWNQADFWDVMLPAQKDALRAVGRKVFCEVRAVLTERAGPSTYAAIEVPTLVLLGARTTPAAERSARLLADALPVAELAEIERAGHLAPLVRAAPIGDRVAEHIDAIEARASQ